MFSTGALNEMTDVQIRSGFRSLLSMKREP